MRTRIPKVVNARLTLCSLAPRLSVAIPKPPQDFVYSAMPSRVDRLTGTIFNQYIATEPETIKVGGDLWRCIPCFPGSSCTCGPHAAVCELLLPSLPCLCFCLLQVILLTAKDETPGMFRALAMNYPQFHFAEIHKSEKEV